MAKHIAKVLTITSALLLAGGLISASPYANERDQSPADTTPQQQQNFSNEEIQQFAKAAEQVGEINNAYFAKMKAASSKKEAAVLQEEANKKMLKAVQAAGLDVSTYNDIAQAALRDTSLQRKIRKAQPD